MKEFTSIHKKIITHLNKSLENGKRPEWMMKGRTCLKLKDEKQENGTSNFRWITYLCIKWKIFTGILAK